MQEEKEIHQELENKHGKVLSTFFTLIEDNMNVWCFINAELRIKDKVAAHCQSCLKNSNKISTAEMCINYINYTHDPSRKSISEERGEKSISCFLKTIRFIHQQRLLVQHKG